MKFRPCVSVRPGTHASLSRLADQRDLSIAALLDQILGDPESWSAAGIAPPGQRRRRPEVR